MIEKQVIVQWYTPDEKMPEECVFVVVTYSGKARNVTYDHALGTGAETVRDGTLKGFHLMRSLRFTHGLTWNRMEVNE